MHGVREKQANAYLSAREVNDGGEVVSYDCRGEGQYSICVSVVMVMVTHTLSVFRYSSSSHEGACLRTQIPNSSHCL